MNLRGLRRNIAYVGQEPVLFNMSIRDNIAFGDDQESIASEDIIDAAISANIHSFIQTLPQVIPSPHLEISLHGLSYRIICDDYFV